MFEDLERLYEDKLEAGRKLTMAKADQNRIIGKLNDAKKAAWERLCDDVIALSKYTRLIDTGIYVIPASGGHAATFKKPDNPHHKTLGFRVYTGGIICLVSICHEDSEGNRLGLPVEESTYCCFEKGKPYSTESTGVLAEHIDDLVPVAAGWDDILPCIKKIIAEKMRADITTNRKGGHNECKSSLFPVYKKQRFNAAQVRQRNRICSFYIEKGIFEE